MGIVSLGSQSNLTRVANLLIYVTVCNNIRAGGRGASVKTSVACPFVRLSVRPATFIRRLPVLDCKSQRNTQGYLILLLLADGSRIRDSHDCFNWLQHPKAIQVSDTCIFRYFARYSFFFREVCLYAKPCIRQPHTARYSKRKTQRGLIYADVPSRISHIKVIMSSNPARGMCVFRLSLCWVFVWRFQDKPVRARRVMYVKLYSIEVCKNISEIKYEENPYL